MAETDNPYKGPYAFEETDAALFFGREAEAETLLSLVISERIVVFCSPSGAGKTSLLKALVIPELRRSGFDVLPLVRVGGELPAAITPANIYVFNTLWTLVGKDPERLHDLSLDAFLPALEAEDAPPRVLVFDQFEEILTTYPERWQERKDFFLQLRKALQHDPTLSVLFALREDRLAGLDPYAPLLPGQLRTRFRMETLRRQDAVAAARKPAQAAGRPFADGVAERLVDDLARVRIAGQKEAVAGELVEPVQLQVVCYQLWENLRGKPGAEVTEEDRRESGDPDRALEGFYESAVHRAAEATGVPQAQIRHWCGTALITPARIRGQVSREPETSGGLPNAAVDFLVDAHLVRAEVARGGTWYELAHDRFIEPVLRSNARTAPSEVAHLTADAQAWREARRDPSFLYRGLRLEEAVQASREAGEMLSPVEREFLAEAQKVEAAEEVRRTRWLRFVTVGLGALLVVVAVLAYAAWQQRRLSFARELALAAIFRTGEDPELSLLLALEAVEKAAIPETEGALHQALRTSLVRRTLSLSIGPETASAFAFNPDGTRFAAIDDEGTVGLWETASGRLITSGSDDQATVLIFSPAGDRVVYGNSDGQLTFWNPGTQSTKSHQVGSSINALAFSPDGLRLAIASDASELMIWNVRSQSLERTLSDGHQGAILGVAFSQDGKYLASAGEDGAAIVWEPQIGSRVILSHPKPVTSVAFRPNGELATGCQDSRARIWDWRAQRIRQDLLWHRDWVSDVAFSRDGKFLATASFDGTAKLWLADSGIRLQTLSPGSDRLFRVAFGPQSHRLVTAGQNRNGEAEATIWNVLLEDAQIFTGDTLSVIEVKFSPDGQRMIMFGQSGQAILWDWPRRHRLATLSQDVSGLSDAEFDPEGKRLVTADRKGMVKIWEVSSGRELLSLPVRKDRMRTATFSSGGLLATAGSNGFELWKLSSHGKSPVLLAKQKLPLLDMAFSPNGNMLAVAGYEEVTLWRASDLQKIRSLTGHVDPVLDIDFSPDGRHLASTDENRSVKIWDVESGQEISTLMGHTAPLKKVTFSQDGKRLASLDFNGSLRLWDLGTGRELFALSGSAGDIYSMAFSPPDGRLLAIGEANGTVRLEPMVMKDLVRLARQRVSRSLTADERRIYLHLD